MSAQLIYRHQVSLSQEDEEELWKAMRATSASGSALIREALRRYLIERKAGILNTHYQAEADAAHAAKDEAHRARVGLKPPPAAVDR